VVANDEASAVVVNRPRGREAASVFGHGRL
jgi:hypothetical protein